MELMEQPVPNHKREQFVILSEDMNDVIEPFGKPQKLYQDFPTGKRWYRCDIRGVASLFH